ncbi:mucin-17 [Xiphias gladius]|uniref:mucin-17 n=1 Tax=Xiphias gladius TaxID=8245 RepID=UPI001A99F7BA|nr:mucin-17 [Xiphias gladius]
MSGDAGELEPRAVGEEAATRLSRTRRVTRTTTASLRTQDDSFGERFQWENHYGDETPTGQEHHLTGIRQEGPHRALIFGADRIRQEEAAYCADSEVQVLKRSEPRFTSLFLTLSKNLSLDKPELKLKPKTNSFPNSLTEPKRAETEYGCCQVNRRTSPPDIHTETASYCPLPTILFPTTKEEQVSTVVCNELETSRDLSLNHSLSYGDFGLYEHNGLHTPACGAQPKRTGCGSVELEGDTKNHTKVENHKDLEELSSPTVTMLSPTVVTVLAPHLSGRLRRTKRFEGTENSEAQGNCQDVTNNAVNCARECFQEIQNQHGVERALIDGSQAQLRVPFLGTRRNTVDWSTKSGPARLDYESKRKMIQTVSLGVNSGKMDNRKLSADALSPVVTAASAISPLSLDPNEQRRNPQTGHQGALSALSSKPTTSSLLLSSRRINSSGRSSNAASTLSEENPLPNDREGKLSTTHLSQTTVNDNEQERSKSLLSPSSISYRTTETWPLLSPSFSNHRERNIPESRVFSTSPINKDTEPFTQQPQTCSKQAFLSRGPSARQQNCRGSDKNTTHSLPRRTTLTSTSRWKQVTPEGSSPLIPNDTTKVEAQPNTPLVPPCNDKSDLALPGPTNNKGFSSQIPNNRENNNTTESVCKGSMNLVMKTQEGTHNPKQRHVEDSLDHKSDRLVKQQYGSNLNNRARQRHHNLPDVFSWSKISRATAHKTLSHPKDLSKRDVSNSSLTTNVTELPHTLLNPKSVNTPTESSTKYNNNHCSSKTNSSPASPHNKDSEKFTKQSLSLATSITLSSQALSSTVTAGLPPNRNTKTSSSSYSHPVSSKTNTHTLSHTSSSSQTPKFTNTTSLGFERSYASIPKPFHTKTVSSLMPTVSTFSNTNYIPVSTASITPSTIGSHPTVATAPSLFLPTSATPVITFSPTITFSSLLTPPATPIITSPNYSETSCPQEWGTFSSSPKRDPKKLHPQVEGKRLRQVMLEDSLALQRSEPITLEKPHPSGVPTSPLSPSRFPRSVRAPSIFSFLRSSSQTTNTSPLCSPMPKTSHIQVGKGGKYRSLSSDSMALTSRVQEKSKQRPSDIMIFDQLSQDVTTSRQERTQSVESGTVQCRSSAPLSRPPDFSGGYKLRYSSPPYSTLMSSRSAQGESKTLTLRSPLFHQASQSNYTPQLSLHTDPGAAMTIPTSKPPLSPISPPPLSLPLQDKTATQKSSKFGISEADQVNNIHSNNSSQDLQNGQILLVDNRFHISSKCLKGDKAHNSSSACVTETLVYSIKSNVDTATAAAKNTTPKPLQHTANRALSFDTKLSQQPDAVQSKEASGEPHSHSDQSSTGGSSLESQSQDDKSCNKRMKESVLGKSRFFSVESSNGQSPKRSRFALKKNVSPPNSSLSRSDSERANKTNNKMDQVLNRLRQTFSTRRSDDDLSFPWKWKKASQTPSVCGSSDISCVSVITVDSTKMLEEKEQEGGVVLKDNEKGTESSNRWAQNKYTIIQASAVGSTMTGDQFSIRSDKSTPETDQVERNACAGAKTERKTQVRLTAHSQTMHQFDVNKDSRTDYKSINQFPSCRDPSPGRSPNPSGGYPNQFRKSTSSPRSPFSPFSSLSPLSSPDVTDDSVFYSPKLLRRRESSSPCEPGEGISLGGSRRSRASTGPPSSGPGQDKERLASSYADLKYGIEPGRSFSVSSVLSNRPSGPGRISTGSRFMSVGDLSESSLTYGGTSMGLDQWLFTPDWTKEYDCKPPSDCSVSYFPSDPGKMRSRSLPRSLTRRLANWSSGVSVSQPVTTTTSKPAHLWSPNVNNCHFGWDTEGPPTPPPTPPMSPVSRRISEPPSLSFPTFPSSSGAPQSVDCQSSRGHLPSRGYVSNLSTFEESSDSSSDTTTDDEYYLETGDGEEKETEL